MLAPCAVHTGAAAGWTCEACGPRCPDCVGNQKAGTGTVPVCTSCGGPVATLTRHRSTGDLAGDLVDIVLFPARPEARFTLIATSIAVALLEFMGGIGWLVAFGGKWAMTFQLLRDTARGRSKLMTLEVNDVFFDLAVPAMTAVAAAALPFLPLLAYAFWASPSHALDHADPIDWVLALAGAAYLPATLLIAGTGTSMTRMLNPLAAVHLLRAFGADGVVASITTIAVEATSILAGVLLARVPYVGWALGSCASVYGALVIGRLLGRLLFRRGDLAGYGRVEDYLVPLLDEAPRGTWKVAAVEEKPRSYAPIELDEPPAAIARAMSEGRYDDALSILKEGGLRPGDVDPVHLVALAQRATGQGDLRLALAVLDSVILANAAHPQAAKALVIAARIHAERLNDRDAAAALFQRAADRFPESEAGRYARSRLAELARTPA